MSTNIYQILFKRKIKVMIYELTQIIYQTIAPTGRHKLAQGLAPVYAVQP